jgi:hypothetical protein
MNTNNHSKCPAQSESADFARWRFVSLAGRRCHRGRDRPIEVLCRVGRDAIAEMLGLSVHEVRVKWTYARAWLKVELDA